MVIEKNVNGFKVTFEFPGTSSNNEQIETEIKEIMLQELKSKIKEMRK